MHYDFDQVICRKNTNSSKWDNVKAREATRMHSRCGSPMAILLHPSPSAACWKNGFAMEFLATPTERMRFVPPPKGGF